jgi:hypothetical protein
VVLRMPIANRWFWAVFIVVGLAVGVNNCAASAKWLFVLRNDEPWWQLVAMLLAGPGTTLLAVVGAWSSPRLAAAWLIGGSLLSVAFFAAAPGVDIQDSGPYIVEHVLPSVAIGVALCLRLLAPQK